ncbi:hypothetical protein ACOYXD_05355 [Pseudomonas sp. MD6]
MIERTFQHFHTQKHPSAQHGEIYAHIEESAESSVLTYHLDKIPEFKMAEPSGLAAGRYKENAPEASSPKGCGTPSIAAFTTASGDTRHGSKANGIAHRS